VAIKSIRDELANLPSGYIALIITARGDYLEVGKSTVKFLLEERRMSGVCITFNKPFKTLSEEFVKVNIDVNKLFFIDGITETATGMHDKSDKCFFMSSPKNLTELAILLEQALGKLPQENRFIFLDSLSTLLIYNETDTVLRFIHALTGKMRLWNVTGVIVFLEKETDENIISQLSQFCDKVISLD
jgi:archaellum biogenesis ATPase FlaH